MTNRCYKDVNRECNINCAAFTLGVISGIDSQRRVLVLSCTDLAAKFKLATEVGEIRKILEKKKK